MMKLDHLEVEIEGGLLLLLPAEVPLIVGTQLLQNIFYLCRLLSDVDLQDLRKSVITSPRASSQSQHINRHLVDPATIPGRDHFQISPCPPPSFSRGGRS